MRATTFAGRLERAGAESLGLRATIRRVSELIRYMAPYRGGRSWPCWGCWRRPPPPSPAR